MKISLKINAPQLDKKLNEHFTGRIKNLIRNDEYLEELVNSVLPKEIDKYALKVTSLLNELNIEALIREEIRKKLLSVGVEKMLSESIQEIQQKLIETMIGMSYEKFIEKSNENTIQGLLKDEIKKIKKDATILRSTKSNQRKRNV